MRILVLLGVVAAAVALPLPDDCDTALLVGGAVPYSGAIPYAGAIPFGGAVAYGGAVPYGGAIQYGGVPAAVPAPVAYAHSAHVHLPPAEVQVPVTHTHVEVPVHQQVHYGTQAYVSGASTTIHKPSLIAPAIAPPSTLISKISHRAPEVTVQHQEVPVEKHTPNYVEKPYHAGTIVKYTAPEVKEIKVPTPYSQPIPVAQPVPVPQPVPVAQPVHSLAVHQAVLTPAVVAVDDDC